ncbi:MAG: hypothetical protein ABSE25_11245 [Syntrophorhabdales bacterium]
MNSDRMRHWLRDMYPIAAVLLVTVAIPFFYGDHAPLAGWRVACKAPLRFLRFASILCIPLFVLPGIYNFFIRSKSAVLLQIERARELKVEPIRHWLFRPFQGIGIGLLFGTKLLGVLQLVAGPSVGSSLLIPEGHFEIRRFLLITLITVFVSLLLSLLWTLDDMGIRYFNRRDQELKMIGKYVGTVMPVIFGFYGIINLMGNYSAAEAFLFAFKIAFVLYPALAVFAVLHTYFLSSRMAQFSKTCVRRGIIQQGE